MSLINDPDQRRKKQWDKIAQSQNGFNFTKAVGFGALDGP